MFVALLGVFGGGNFFLISTCQVGCDIGLIFPQEQAGNEDDRLDRPCMKCCR